MFVDSALGFVIQHPSSISLISKPDYPGIVVHSNGKRIIFIDDYEIMPGQSDIRSFATEIAIQSCAADGPDGSQWAEDIDSAIVKKNSHGVTHVELHLRKLETFQLNSRSEIVGPFFVVDLSSAKRRHCVMLDWRPDWKPTAIQISACRSIIENITLLNE
jgi:hypothetical protein